MPTITVNEALCTKCSICNAVCVMGILEKDSETGYPILPKEKEPYCFLCGHCEAFCPSKAIVVDYLTEEKTKADISEMTIPADRLSLYMKNRRSGRHFLNKPVEKELILKLLDTARYGATGSNSQAVEWLVIYDTQIVKEIAKLTIDWMRTILNTPHPLAPYVSNIVQMWDNGIDFICHNAPHIIISHIPKSPFINDPTDGIIALTHFDLLAPSYGIGTCWAGFIKMGLMSYPELRAVVGLPENRTVAYPMLFGYSKFKPITIPRRKPLTVEWK